MVNPGMKESLSSRELEILRLITDGMADKQIAAQLHLSLNTVKWHNRQVYAKLGVSNRTQAVSEARQLGLLEGEEAPKRQIPRIPHNLPAPVSSFVGRKQEIEEIQDLLKTNRLVTLTGPGGVGKTSLALETARTLLAGDNFSDGIYFIELGPVLKPEWVGSAILEGLRFSPPAGEPVEQTLDLFLEERTILLILDNFEHLLDSAPLVSQLLSSAPDFKVLATSREALNLTGEQLYSVPPLGIHPSQELFIHRAGKANSKFDPRAEEGSRIDEICARLDHLPLAIELAAARMNLFNLEELSTRLLDCFTTLSRGPRDAPDRHQSLQAAIDWSYNLLTEEEQILFRRLAVFQGSRSIEAVQEVCCFDLELAALDGLESLLNKSLLKLEESLVGEPRFFFLETLHGYAKERLLDCGEELEIRRRHAEYFLSFAQSYHDAHWFNRDVVFWLKKAYAEIENFRAVYDWTESQGEDLLRLKLNASLFGFWVGAGYLNEGRIKIESVLKIADRAPARLRARIYRAAALYSRFFREFDRSRELYGIALPIFQELDEIYYIGCCHLDLAKMLVDEYELDQDRFLAHFNQAMELFIEYGDLVAISEAWISLGSYYHEIGDDELAYQAYKKALVLARESGIDLVIWTAKVWLAKSELDRGQTAVAKELLVEVLSKESAYFEDHHNIEGTFERLAGPELALGQPGRAVTLLSVGNRLRTMKGGSAAMYVQEDHTRKTLNLAKEQLDQATFKEAWNRGQVMSFEEAVAFALEEID